MVMWFNYEMHSNGIVVFFACGYISHIFPCGGGTRIYSQSTLYMYIMMVRDLLIQERVDRH